MIPAKILVVDDDEDFRDLLAEMIFRMGYEAATARDAETGLQLLGNEAFDAALIDFQMPGMTGVQLLRRIKKMDDNISVIIISGLDNEQMAAEALAGGADAFIIKPVDIDILESTLKQALGKEKS
jgi:DNA-binding NtrC family response regulator